MSEQLPLARPPIATRGGLAPSDELEGEAGSFHHRLGILWSCFS